MPAMPASRGVSADQQLALPIGAARPPRRAARAVDLHVISRPAGTFTGDFFFSHRRGARLWFAIGDVAGKGLNAAVIMAMIQEELEHRITSCASAQCDPSATMTRLHAFLRPLLPSNRFATAIVGFIQDDGSMVLVNAGHCPMLIAHRDGTVTEIGSTGPVLGLLSDARWTSVRVTLRPGDTLLLYSDGASELTDSQGQELGTAGLIRMLGQALPQPSARAGAETVMRSIHSFADGAFHDDLTLAVVRT